jgi:PEP-CTERM motif-containing protein
MRLPVCLFSVAVVSLLAVCPLTAHADTFAVTYTNGGLNFTFDIPSSPTPSNFVTGEGFEVDNLTAIGSFGTETIDVAFYDADGSVHDGGFGWSTFGVVDILTGPQMFTGPDSAPTLLIGVYNLTAQNETATLKIAELPPSVPEPSTFALFGTGILGLAGMARHKFSRT